MHSDRVTRGTSSGSQLVPDPMTGRLGDPDAACRDGKGWEFDTKAGERDDCLGALLLWLFFFYMCDGALILSLRGAL